MSYISSGSSVGEVTRTVTPPQPTTTKPLRARERTSAFSTPYRLLQLHRIEGRDGGFPMTFGADIACRSFGMLNKISFDQGV